VTAGDGGNEECAEKAFEVLCQWHKSSVALPTGMTAAMLGWPVSSSVRQGWPVASKHSGALGRIYASGIICDGEGRHPLDAPLGRAFLGVAPVDRQRRSAS